jgi:predicted AAA+ superfamily ATPase
MADNIGNLTSIKKISDTTTSDGIKVLSPTIESYLKAFRNSYILYRVGRYDVKGKKILKTLDKYYLVDVGLRYYLLGDKKADFGHILENIIYLELIRRGYKVYVRKVDAYSDKKVKALEVDFVAEGLDGTEYYQVSETVRDKNVLVRELASLEAVSDHNSKYLLTMDFEPLVSHNGIKQINVLDWLIG